MLPHFNKKSSSSSYSSRPSMASPTFAPLYTVVVGYPYTAKTERELTVAKNDTLSVCSLSLSRAIK